MTTNLDPSPGLENSNLLQGNTGGPGDGSGGSGGGGGGAPAAEVNQNGTTRRGILFGLEYPEAGADWALNIAERRHAPTLPVASFDNNGAGNNPLTVRLPHSFVQPSSVSGVNWLLQMQVGQHHVPATVSTQATGILYASPTDTVNGLRFTVPVSRDEGSASNGWQVTARLASAFTNGFAGRSWNLNFQANRTLTSIANTLGSTIFGTVEVVGDGSTIFTHAAGGATRSVTLDGGTDAAPAIDRDPLSASLNFDSQRIEIICVDTDTIAEIAAVLRAMMYNIRLSTSPIDPYAELDAPYSQGQFNETGLVTFNAGAQVLDLDYFSGGIGTGSGIFFSTGVDIEGFETSLDIDNKEIGIKYHDTDNISLIASGYDERKVGDGQLRTTIIHDTVETDRLESPPISSRPFIDYYADGVGSGESGGVSSSILTALSDRINSIHPVVDGEFSDDSSELDLVLSDGTTITIAVPDELRQQSVPITFHQAHSQSDFDQVRSGGTGTVRIVIVTNYFLHSVIGIAYRPRDVISFDTENNVRTIVRGLPPQVPSQGATAKKYVLNIATNGVATWVEAEETGSGGGTTPTPVDAGPDDGRASYAGDLTLYDYGYTALGTPVINTVRLNNPVNANFDRPVLLHLSDDDGHLTDIVNQFVGSTITVFDTNTSNSYIGVITSVSVNGRVVTFNNVRVASSALGTTNTFNIIITSSVISRIGGQIIGQLLVPEPTLNQQAANKAYVDRAIADGGGTMPADHFIFGLSDDAVPVAAEGTITANNGMGDLPVFTSKHILIFRLDTEDDILSVIFSDDPTSANQAGAFAKYGSVITISGSDYNAWVSDQVLTFPAVVTMTVS